MRSSQWLVLGLISSLISMYFLYRILTAREVAILEVNNIAFLITLGFGFACLINGLLDCRAEENNKKHEEREKWNRILQYLEEKAEMIRKTLSKKELEEFNKWKCSLSNEERKSKTDPELLYGFMWFNYCEKLDAQKRH